MTMTIAMIMNLLTGTMVIKKCKTQKAKTKEELMPIACTHQVEGIGVFLRIRKNRQKNCGWLFLII